MNDPLSLIYEATILTPELSVKHRVLNRIELVNGIKVIRGDVSLGHALLTSLPDLHDVYVTGFFDCSENHLIDLYGCPVRVGSAFYCNKNKLINLKHSPKYVGGEFDCADNRIHILDLENGPEFIGENFYCEGNPLPKGTPGILSSSEYQEYRKKLKLQKEFGDDIGQTIHDL